MLQTALVDRKQTYAERKEIVAAIDTLLGIGGVTGDLEATLWEHRDLHADYVAQAEYVTLAMEALLSDDPREMLLSVFATKAAPTPWTVPNEPVDAVERPAVAPKAPTPPVEPVVEPSKVDPSTVKPSKAVPIDPVLLSTIAGMVTNAEPTLLTTAEIYMTLHKQDTSVEPRAIVAAIVEMKRKGTIEEIDGRLRLTIRRTAKATRPTLRADVTNQEIQSIRHLAAKGETYQKLAEAFGVSRGTIGNILNRKGAYA